VPQDISVVGFADLDFAPMMTPPLTSVRQKGYEVGSRAARVLINRIQGKFAQNGIQNIKMNCELVVRGSTAPVRPV
jgi:DNA-binding LacI/PurR family transcriptional regulator